MGGRRGRRVVMIDASVLSAAERLPSHCSRHGQPAAKLLSFNIISRPGVRRRLVVSIPVIGPVVEPEIDKTNTVHVRDLPYCRRCHRRQRLGLLTAAAVFAVGFVGCTGTFLGAAAARLASGQYVHPIVAVPIGLGFALMLIALIPVMWAVPGSIVRAKTTDDGTGVQFTDPHPEFSRQMRALVGRQWPEQSA